MFDRCVRFLVFAFTGIIWLFFLLAGICIIASNVRGQDYTHEQVKEFRTCLNAHNAARKGLEPLVLDKLLTDAAMKHAAWMAKRGVLSHVTPRAPHGAMWFQRAANSGYPATAANCSENIAQGPAGHMDAATACDLWLKSKVGHRDNVLGQWRHVGFGYAVGRKGVYWVALYANPRSVVR